MAVSLAEAPQTSSPPPTVPLSDENWPKATGRAARNARLRPIDVFLILGTSHESTAPLGDERRSGKHPLRRRPSKKCPGSFR